MSNRTIILNHKQICNTIKRMAFEILEYNLNEEKIILVGIEGNGYILAEKLYSELKTKTEIQITLCKIFINKKNLLSNISTSINLEQISHKSIVLIDDVLHSGGTLIYGVKYLLNIHTKLLQTVVLINRNHKKYPVKADIKGLSLSTSLQKNIEVAFEENNYRVYLT